MLSIGPINFEHNYLLKSVLRWRHAFPIWSSNFRNIKINSFMNSNDYVIFEKLLVICCFYRMEGGIYHLPFMKFHKICLWHPTLRRNNFYWYDWLLYTTACLYLFCRYISLHADMANLQEWGLISYSKEILRWKALML